MGGFFGVRLGRVQHPRELIEEVGQGALIFRAQPVRFAQPLRELVKARFEVGR